MNKLKTLHDIEPDLSYMIYGWKNPTDKVLVESDIRKLAIKWVKYYRPSLFGSLFQKFFDITEKDLK